MINGKWFPSAFSKVCYKNCMNFYTHNKITKSCDSSVGIALGYRVEDRGSRVRFPAGAGNLSLHHHVENGSGALPASYPMGTRGSFPGGKAHLHVVSRSKNEWSYISTPPICLHGVVHRDNFTFTIKLLSSLPRGSVPYVQRAD
jgi:hypothetical protein